MVIIAHSTNQATKDLNPREERRLASTAWRSEFAALLERRGFDIQRTPGHQKEADFYVRTAFALRQCSDPDLFVAVSVCSEDESHYMQPVCPGCDNRMCSICAPALAAALVAEYAEIVKNALRAAPQGYSLKHLVFTTPDAHTDPDICQKRRLRQQQVYKALEMVLGCKQRRWSKEFIGALVSWEFGGDGRKLHFHVDLLSPFIGSGQKVEVVGPDGKISRIHDGKRLLTEAWQTVTGGECSVTYLHRVARPADGVRYALKYVTKLTQLAPSDALLVFQCLYEAGADGRIHTVQRVRALGVFHNPPDEWKRHEHIGEVKCWCGALVTTRRRQPGDLAKVKAYDRAAVMDAALLDLRIGNPVAGFGDGDPTTMAIPPPEQLQLLPKGQGREYP